MRFAVATLFALGCCAMAGCSAFPEQGFVTKSLGGTVADALPGTAPSAQSQVYTVPEPVGGEDLRRPDACTEEARNRADDAKLQGFDEDLQKRVYDATFADCSKWAPRH